MPVHAGADLCAYLFEFSPTAGRASKPGRPFQERIVALIDEIKKISPDIPSREVAQMLGCSVSYVFAARHRIRSGTRYRSRKTLWQKAGFDSENDWRRSLINKRKK